jgi:hypothetical protein
MTQTANNLPDNNNLYPEGFLALRSGIFDHLNQSRFTANDWMVYTILLRQCDWQSGRWNGNAYRIRAAVGNSLTIRQIQHAMRRLVEKGYTKTFHKQGAKGNYFVLIHKYRVCVGNLKGKVLNALKSDSYTRPLYEDECEREVISTVGGCERDLTWMSPSPDVDIYQELKNTKSKEVQESNPPTIQEPPAASTSEGRTDGGSRSQSKRTSDKLTALLSDCLREKSGNRCFPTKAQASVFRTEVGANGEPDMVLAFLLFLSRSKGVGTLADPWGMFINELPAHLTDADYERREIGSAYESEADMLSDIWERSFRETDSSQKLLARATAVILPNRETGEPEADGDFSELDAIPELDLSAVPELDTVGGALL